MKKYKTEKQKDFLDEIIEERTKKNPNFPKMMEEASKKRKKKLKSDDGDFEDAIPLKAEGKQTFIFRKGKLPMPGWNEDEPDFLDELVGEWGEKDPEFEKLLEESVKQRKIKGNKK